MSDLIFLFGFQFQLNFTTMGYSVISMVVNRQICDIFIKNFAKADSIAKTKNKFPGVGHFGFLIAT
jgi:hypothetical protein